MNDNVVYMIYLTNTIRIIWCSLWISCCVIWIPTHACKDSQPFHHFNHVNQRLTCNKPELSKNKKCLLLLRAYFCLQKLPITDRSDQAISILRQLFDLVKLVNDYWESLICSGMQRLNQFCCWQIGWCRLIVSGNELISEHFDETLKITATITKWPIVYRIGYNLCIVSLFN